MSEEAAEQTGSTGGLVLQAVLRTDVGLVRSENQDFGTCTTPAEESEGGPGGRLLVVADGMGGHRGGATASKLAAETLKAQYLGSDAGDIATALREALTRANARIYTEAQANADLRGMGTTTSALVVRGNQAWFAHVGDSRIYLVRGTQISQLTEDHSLVASMVREGLITREEAEVHPRRNVLQRSVGVSEFVEIDVRGPIELEAGDTFVICSDGLHGLVREPELRQIAWLPIEEAADLYVTKAIERGAPDNVTVIVARVDTPDGAGEKHLRAIGQGAVADTIPFDETSRDAQGAASFDPVPPARPHVEVTVPTPAVVPATSPAALRNPQSGSIGRILSLLWVSIGVLSLGVAGWWLFWSK